MLKILQVVPSYFPAFVYGGPIYSIHYLVQSISKLGHSVNVLTTNANGEVRLDVPTKKDVYLEDNYHVRYCHDDILEKISFEFIVNLPKYVNRSHLVHLHDIFSSYALITIFYCCIIKKPIILSPRGCFSKWSLKSSKYFLKIFIIKFLIKPLTSFNKVIWHVTCDQEKNEVEKLIPKSKIEIIPNGLNLNEFREIKPIKRSNFLKKYNIKSTSYNKFIIMGTLGRLHKKKSLDVAINAISLLKDSDIDAILFIVGPDSGMKNKLRLLVKNKKLLDRVFFLDQISGKEKIQYLKSLDIFLMPSESENFGMVALESLASGVPVVASTNTPWSILNKANAGISCLNNAQSFTNSIKEIISNDIKSYKKSALLLSKEFEYSKVAKMIERLYLDLK